MANTVIKEKSQKDYFYFINPEEFFLQMVEVRFVYHLDWLVGANEAKQQSEKLLHRSKAK